MPGPAGEVEDIGVQQLDAVPESLDSLPDAGKERFPVGGGDGDVVGVGRAEGGVFRAGVLAAAGKVCFSKSTYP